MRGTCHDQDKMQGCHSEGLKYLHLVTDKMKALEISTVAALFVGDRRPDLRGSSWWP